jgi:hypothetical protein
LVDRFLNLFFCHERSANATLKQWASDANSSSIECQRACASEKDPVHPRLFLPC